MGRGWKVAAAVAIVAGSAWGCRQGNEITVLHGPARVALDGGFATLELPVGYQFVDRGNMERGAKILKHTAHLGPEDLGLVTRGETDPAVLIQHKSFPQEPDFDPSAAWADSLLPVMQARVKSAGGAIAGWAVAPKYIQGRTGMVAAVKDHYPDGKENGSVVGYLMGRTGYLYLYCEVEPTQLGPMVAEVQELLQATKLADADRRPAR